MSFYGDDADVIIDETTPRIDNDIEDLTIEDLTIEDLTIEDLTIEVELIETKNDIPM